VHQRTLIAVAAAVLSLGTAPAGAQSNAELLKIVEDLKKQVQELKEQVKAITPPAASADGKAAQWGDITPASQSDLDGLRADLENYKYDQSRQYERTTAKTTRNTTIDKDHIIAAKIAIAFWHVISGFANYTVCGKRFS